MKMDFTQPPPKPKTLKEAQEIINALWCFCAELSKRVDEQQKTIKAQLKRIELLEENLKTNSKNSSLPPSMDIRKNKKSEKPKKNNKKKRKQGAQPGHKGIHRSLLPESEVDHIEKHKPIKQCDCGAIVVQTGEYLRHQVNDLPKIKAIVTEYQLLQGLCKGCGKTHYPDLPLGVPSGMLGPNAMAKISTLTGDYRMSKRKVTYLFEDFYSLKICIGTVSNSENIISKALQVPVEEAKDFIPKQSTVHSDETSFKESNNKMWAWVCISSLVAIFVIRASRGAQVIKDILGNNFKGILCTDRWTGYAWMAAIFRQICWAHLLRDFTKISERTGKSGKIGKELLKYSYQMFSYWHKIRDGKITREQFKKLMEPIRKEIEVLLENGANCRNKKTAGMCKQILKIKAALWTFVEQEGIEPTNNIAERIIRSLVIWRKTSFGTQSARGTLYLERIMTVAATCRLQKRNVLEFVTDAIKAYLTGTQAPSLIPQFDMQEKFKKVA
jgi:transposase